ncbi:hypothetical protein M775_02040 [Neisseria gonorrhoeae MU_NG6]|nr:hypothetical protein M771_06855 [Neisseria gonorrhoeae MU_NG1]KLS90544.1 hypothetical protein M775_02040 [Neisseria gonorrhoeae MU_NG6]
MQTSGRHKNIVSKIRTGLQPPLPEKRAKHFILEKPGRAADGTVRHKQHHARIEKDG